MSDKPKELADIVEEFSYSVGLSEFNTDTLDSIVKDAFERGKRAAFAEAEAMKDLAIHLRMCADCAQTDVLECFEGSKLYRAAFQQESLAKEPGE